MTNEHGELPVFLDDGMPVYKDFSQKFHINVDNEKNTVSVIDKETDQVLWEEPKDKKIVIVFHSPKEFGFQMMHVVDITGGKTTIEHGIFVLMRTFQEHEEFHRMMIDICANNKMAAQLYKNSKIKHHAIFARKRLELFPDHEFRLVECPMMPVIDLDPES